MVMDSFERSLFDSISPDSLSSSSLNADIYESVFDAHRTRSSSSNSELYVDSPNTGGEINENVRRQRRKEQNRAAQRAYRERKVNHTMELESRINYLEVHIEELTVENKQLEVEIAQTRVQNGVLRTNLHATRQSISESKRTASPMPPVPNVVSNQQIQTTPVLLKDLLMLYGPHTGNEIP